jgi:hypothetical protein
MAPVPEFADRALRVPPQRGADLEIRPGQAAYREPSTMPWSSTKTGVLEWTLISLRNYRFFDPGLPPWGTGSDLTASHNT